MSQLCGDPIVEGRGGGKTETIWDNFIYLRQKCSSMNEVSWGFCSVGTVHVTQKLLSNLFSKDWLGSPPDHSDPKSHIRPISINLKKLQSVIENVKI